MRQLHTYLLLTFCFSAAFLGCSTPERVYNTEIIYAGTFAERESKGIYVLEFNRSDKSLKVIQEVGGVISPSFLVVHPNRKYLYSVNRSSAKNEGKWGTVTSFNIKEDGKLELMNEQSSCGAEPCYISINDEGNLALVAHYNEGTVVALPINEDGTLQPVTDSSRHEGNSVHRTRQSEPHVHAVVPSPDGQFFYAPDLGIDKIMIYKLDESKKGIQESDPAFAWTQPGAGPRHFTFHPKGHIAYLAEELSNMVSVYSYNGTSGKLTEMQRVSTLPDDFSDENTVADIHVHPNGKFLYVSNRGHQSIASYAIDEEGRLEPIGHTPVEGEHPRNFLIDPKGEFMFVANLHANNVTIFTIDQNTGALNFTGNQIQISGVVCLKYL